MTGLPRMLIVEDDRPSLEVLKIFSLSLIVVDAATNGADAVELARKNKYTAVIMDINLGPGMSGIDAVTEIRKIPGYENVPILALTAYAMMGDKENFLEAGCTHYLSKPYSKSQLLEQIKDMIN